MKPTVHYYTDPKAFTEGVEEGWAEPIFDPAQIEDWDARIDRANIKYIVRHGRPVNPCEDTGIRHGRGGLGNWGENFMADAITTARVNGQLHILLIERDDSESEHVWAVPGGGVEPGETGLEAALRELEEETGLPAPSFLAHDLGIIYVEDPRATNEAWAVTNRVWIDWGDLPFLPEVNGGTDARRAAWFPAPDFATLSAIVAAVYEGTIYSAHVKMLNTFFAETIAPRDTARG